MAAPKGNKNAVGRKDAQLGVAGRKPVYSMEEESKAIEEWALKETSRHLAEFALERGTYPERLYEWRDSNSQFAIALACAKARLALRIRAKLDDETKKCNEKLALRDIACHDKLLQLDEREEYEWKAKTDASARKAAGLSNETIPPNSAAIGQLAESVKENSAAIRKLAEHNSEVQP